MNYNFENIPEISFIENLSLEELQESMFTWYKEKYKELTGSEKVFAKADPERLKLNTCALVLYQMFMYIDRQAKMNLLKYSHGEYLDNLGYGRVSRKRGTKAITTVRFTLSEARNSLVTIPKGTRVAAGNKYFASKEVYQILAGKTYIDIPCESLEIGTASNGLGIGEINTLVDPIAYIESVKNISITNSGTDIESDEDFAKRIYLASSSFSVAGPEDAYRYFVNAFSSDIADVNITSPSLGMVDIRVVLKNGELPNEDFIRELTEYISDKSRKPITDKIEVSAPVLENYNIDLTYYINESDKSVVSLVQARVKEAINEYKVWQDSRIGKDINPSELIKRIILAGAKRVEIRNPIFMKVASTKLAHCTAINIVYGGLEDD